ncbi:hypothetical protein SCLCIDRAFT_799710 [Scleroderma citrinum Foug A]|uniref:Uncharacterized protein n=1 Tax=Scleroderma citrinum Foug A TaxID=1036808 RepID=A0A0C3E318_9AGAM|nr:hypothetical protein SCLCIDRAFT_799710 [Scleroderma citrinum Foug A]
MEEKRRPVCWPSPELTAPLLLVPHLSLPYRVNVSSGPSSEDLTTIVRGTSSTLSRRERKRNQGLLRKLSRRGCRPQALRVKTCRLSFISHQLQNFHSCWIRGFDSSHSCDSRPE